MPYNNPFNEYDEDLQNGYQDEELEDELALTDDDPYTSVHSREPLQDMTLEGRIQDSQQLAQKHMDESAPQNKVRDVIAQRRGVPALPSGDSGDDGDLSSLRQAKVTSNLIGNIGNAASQAAMGPAKPQRNSGLYSDIGKQNSELLRSSENDVNRRNQIKRAIELRRSIEGEGEKNRLSREQIAKDRLMNRQNGMTENQKALEKARAQRTDNTNIRTAGSLFQNPTINREITKLNASRSAQSLIEAIKSGELKDSKNISKQLTNIIATIELGSPGGQGDREQMGVQSLYTDLQNAKAYLTSGTESSIPPQQLKQIETEVYALGDRAAKNYKALTDSSISGSDLSLGQEGQDQGKIYELARRRQHEFLTQNGYNPETGERIPTEIEVTPEATPQIEKKIKGTFFSPSRNKTKIIYDDGTEELFDGKR